AFPAAQQKHVHDLSLEVIRTGMHQVFPDGTDPADPGALRWELLVDPSAGVGAARFEQQYWRANLGPPGRHGQAGEGSSPHRLRADGSGFENLYLAGDWVATGLNAGCVESAVMGGLQAARAICGHPDEIAGENDF